MMGFVMIRALRGEVSGGDVVDVGMVAYEWSSSMRNSRSSSSGDKFLLLSCSGSLVIVAVSVVALL